MKKSLHIVIYSELFEYGGGRETWLSYFLPGLIKAKQYNEIYIYHIYPRNKANNLSEQINDVKFTGIEIGIPESGNPFLNVLKFTYKSVKAIQQNICDGDSILLIGTLLESLTGLTMRLLRGNRIKIGCWIRSIASGEIRSRRASIYGNIAVILENNIFNFCDIAIANGKDTLAYYTNKYTNLVPKATLIENAVDFVRYSDIPYPDFDEEVLKVAFLGRMSPEKGFNEFVESARVFQSRNRYGSRRMEFHVWGQGQFHDSTGLVHIHGPVVRDQILETISKCHCVVFLNKSEANAAGGLSHALLEAMAMGRIIIGWDNPSHSQVLSNDNSFLVPEGDVEELVNAYDQIAKIRTNNVNLFESMCRKVREKASSFSLEKHLNKFRELDI